MNQLSKLSSPQNSSQNLYYIPEKKIEVGEEKNLPQKRIHGNKDLMNQKKKSTFFKQAQRKHRFELNDDSGKNDKKLLMKFSDSRSKKEIDL